MSSLSKPAANISADSQISLTKMSTDIDSLVGSYLSLWTDTRGRKEWRKCYITKEIADFLAAHKTKNGIGKTSPTQQVVSLLNSFTSGRSYHTIGQFDDGKPEQPLKKLQPISPEGPNIWEMRTTDVRVFGWVHTTENTFIAVLAELKMNLVDSQDKALPMEYGIMIFHVLFWIKQHSIDPKFIWKKNNDYACLHFRA